MIGNRKTTPLRTILENCMTHIDKLETTRSVCDHYEKEFQDLKQFSENLKTKKEYACTEGEKEVNKKKNRYKDILPFNLSRVVLAEINSNAGSNYVNANYIKGASGSPAYIASQGPLPNTVNDFWRMVVECEVQVIIMACNAEEAGKHKCENYWVEREAEERTFGNVEIKLIKANIICPDFLVRTMRLKYTNEKAVIEERTVCQFHYSAWPDHGVPPLVRPLLDMVRLVRDTQASETLPVLVHCSAGCGRTGTICAIDFVWGLLRLGKLSTDFSLFNLVRDMRKQRVAMVQTKEQYILVHQAVRELFKEQLQIIESHHYENLNPKGEPLLQNAVEPIYETLVPIKVYSEEKQDRNKVDMMDNATLEFCRKNAPPLPKKKCPSIPSSKHEKEVENLTEKNRTAVSQNTVVYADGSPNNSLSRKPKIAKLKALFERRSPSSDRSSSKTNSHAITRSHSLGPVRKPILTEVSKPEVKPTKTDAPIQSRGKLKVPKLITATSVYTRPIPHVKRSKSLKMTKESTPLLTLLQYASTDDLIDDRHQPTRTNVPATSQQGQLDTSKNTQRKQSLTEQEILMYHVDQQKGVQKSPLNARLPTSRSADSLKEVSKGELSTLGWNGTKDITQNHFSEMPVQTKNKEKAKFNRLNLGQIVETSNDIQKNQLPVGRQIQSKPTTEPLREMLKNHLTERIMHTRNAIRPNMERQEKTQRNQVFLEKHSHPVYELPSRDMPRQQSMTERVPIAKAQLQKEPKQLQVISSREKYDQSRRRRSLDSLIGEELPEITWPNSMAAPNQRESRQDVQIAIKQKPGLSLKHQLMLLSHASQRTMNSLASGLGIRERRNSFRQAVSKEDSLDRIGAQFGTEGRFISVPEDGVASVYVDATSRPYRETLTVRTQNGEILKPGRSSQHHVYQENLGNSQQKRQPVHRLDAPPSEKLQTRRHPLPDGKEARISSQSMRLPSKNRFLYRLKTELQINSHSPGVDSNIYPLKVTSSDQRQKDSEQSKKKWIKPDGEQKVSSGEVQTQTNSAWRDRGHYLLGIRGFKSSPNRGTAYTSSEILKQPLTRTPAIDPQIAEYIAFKDMKSAVFDSRAATTMQRSAQPYVTSDDLHVTHHPRKTNPGPQFLRVGKSSSASSQSSDNLSDHPKGSPMLMDSSENRLGKNRPRPTEVTRLTGDRLKLEGASSESSSSSGARELYSVMRLRGYDAQTQRGEATWSAISRSKSTSQAFEELSKSQPVAPPRVRRRSSTRGGSGVSRHNSLDPLEPQSHGWTLTKTQSSADAREWGGGLGVDLDAVAASMQRKKEPFPANSGEQPSLLQPSSAPLSLRKQQYF